MVSFWPFFFVKNTNFDFKLTQIHQYSIFVKSDTYFIKFLHYKQDYFSTARISAGVLPAAEHLKFRGFQPSSYIAAILKNK